MKDKNPKKEKEYKNTYKGKSGVSHGEVYGDGYSTKRNSKPLDGSFTGSAAPRVGGAPVKPSSGVPTGGTKRQLSESKARVNKSAASPQAKRSARKLY
jgi:hypothetical protein